MMFGNSSHFKSTQDNVKKKDGIPNCLTIANKPSKNCFHNAEEPLIEIIKEKELFLLTVPGHIPYDST